MVTNRNVQEFTKVVLLKAPFSIVKDDTKCFDCRTLIRNLIYPVQSSFQYGAIFAECPLVTHTVRDLHQS